MKRNVERYIGGSFLINGALVQSDWDYPGAARSVGWSLCRVQHGNGRTRFLSRRSTSATACRHLGTDGTIDCQCGVTAVEFIRAAAEYLDGLASW